MSRGGAGRQHGGGERDAFATVELDLVCGAVERFHGATGEQLDVVARVEVVVVHAGRLGGGLAAQHGLGERRALVRRCRLVADENHSTVEAVRAGALGRLGAGQARSDDDQAVFCGHCRRLFVVH